MSKCQSGNEIVLQTEKLYDAEEGNSGGKTANLQKKLVQLCDRLFNSRTVTEHVQILGKDLAQLCADGVSSAGNGRDTLAVHDGVCLIHAGHVCVLCVVLQKLAGAFSCDITEYEYLKTRVTANAVGAVDSADSLAAGVKTAKPLYGAIAVYNNAAERGVGSGCYLKGGGGNIYAHVRVALNVGGVESVKLLSANARSVKEHAAVFGASALRDLAEYAARLNVLVNAFRILGIIQHKALALCVLENCALKIHGGDNALAAQLLGGNCGIGLKLNKFHIGKLCARVIRHCNAVAADILGVGGEGIDIAEAAAGKDYYVGNVSGEHFVSIIGNHCADNSVVLLEKTESAGVFHKVYCGVSLKLALDGVHDRNTGVIAGTCNSGHACAERTEQRVAAVCIAVELYSKLLKNGNKLGRLAAKSGSQRHVALSATAHEGILEEEVNGILRVQGHIEAVHVGRSADARAENGYAAALGLSQAARRHESGDSGPDDERIKSLNVDIFRHFIKLPKYRRLPWSLRSLRTG